MGWDSDHPYWLECWFSEERDREPFLLCFPEIPHPNSIIVLGSGEKISVINVWWKDERDKGNGIRPTLHCLSLGKDE